MTEEEFKKLADQIWLVIESSQNILLHLHPSPDPDSAGSALSMYWLLKNLGKNPVVIKGDSDIPNWLKFLPGGDTVTSQNFSQIDTNNFDLFLILDSSSPDRITNKSEVKFDSNLRTVVIDHHVSNLYFGQINFVETKATSTAGMLYDLYKYWGVKITSEMAACIYSGLYTDTGGYKYPPTNTHTFTMASELTSIYPEFSELIYNLENQKDPEQIIYFGLALSNIKSYGNFAIAEIPYEILQSHGIKKHHTEMAEVANEIKSVVGWNLGISLVEAEPKVISLSFRTRNATKYDVAKIALKLGGGGHKAAAGATLKMPFVKAKKFLLDTIYSVYPDLK